MQVGVARPDAAGVRGAERNDGFARKVVAFEEGENDFRSLAPPDGIAEKNHIVIGEVLACTLDGGACRWVVLLAVGTRRRIVVVQVFRRVGRFGLDAPSRCTDRLDNPVGNAFGRVRAGEPDHQGTAIRRLRIGCRVWIRFRVGNGCRYFAFDRFI